MKFLILTNLFSTSCGKLLHAKKFPQCVEHSGQVISEPRLPLRLLLEICMSTLICFF